MSSDLRPIRIIDLVLVKLEFPQHRRINRLEGRVQNSDAYLEFPQHRRTNRLREQCYRIVIHTWSFLSTGVLTDSESSVTE